MIVALLFIGASIIYAGTIITTQLGKIEHKLSEIYSVIDRYREHAIAFKNVKDPEDED